MYALTCAHSTEQSEISIGPNLATEAFFYD